MDGRIHSSLELEYSVDGDDAKYVSGLSTFLVATIQEAKDRISQIEYIFCTQLFPNFQSKSKNLQRVYSDTRKAMEVEWKKKENDFIIQIENIHLENKKVLEENQLLKLDNEKLSKEFDRERGLLLSKQRNIESKVSELEQEVRQKSREVDEGMVLQNKLLQLVQSKASIIIDKKKQLRVCEEKMSMLTADMKISETKIEELQEEIKERDEESARGKELQQNLQEKIDMQASEILNTKQTLYNLQKEKELITAKLEHLQMTVDRLTKELEERPEEVEKGRKLQEQYIKEINLKDSDFLMKQHQSDEHEKQKKLYLIKIKGLEEKISELQVKLAEKRDEVSGEKESRGNPLQPDKSKVSELLLEKNKRREAIAAYKKLKSQYSFLLGKFGLTVENSVSQGKMEEETDILRSHDNPTISPSGLIDPENEKPDISAHASDPMKAKGDIGSQEELIKKESSSQDESNSEREAALVHASSSVEKCPPASLAGTKRPASHWRGTRSRQGQCGPDPHDDFLDTPFENIRRDLNKVPREEAHDLPYPVPKDMDFDNSEYETQSLTPVLRTGVKDLKYVEPVRKKAERENLKGIECKQCKKFYDAVLPDGGGKVADGSKRYFRCEHHEGVSRHRYRYVPPMTPEGFWNIGFDSEM